jgi:hypothetical protein
MQMNKIIHTSVGADLSALDAFSDIRIISLKPIIGHRWIFWNPDYFVKPHKFRHSSKKTRQKVSVSNLIEDYC